MQTLKRWELLHVNEEAFPSEAVVTNPQIAVLWEPSAIYAKNKIKLLEAPLLNLFYWVKQHLEIALIPFIRGFIEDHRDEKRLQLLK